MKYNISIRMKDGTNISNTVTLSESDIAGSSFLAAKWLKITCPDGGMMCISTDDISFVDLKPEYI